MDKQHIRDEIRRTASTNGGVPLGRARFLQETGIRDADWHGKYWPRWNDAVREAGYIPNQMQQPYEDDVLIEKFIHLIRDLGHFPVTGEIRLAGRNDPKIPNDKTFRRLGSKNKLASRIVEYCRWRTGYDDVIELCAGLSQTNQPLATTSELLSEPKSIGFVYLLKSGTITSHVPEQAGRTHDHNVNPNRQNGRPAWRPHDHVCPP